MEEFVKTAGKESKREVQESYPLTNTQEGIFIECTANMGSTIYNIPYLLKLDNKVDLDRLAEAIDSTVEAHPYLKPVCLWMTTEMYFRNETMGSVIKHRF
mgnify:CR=1 FL=1